MRPAVRFSGDLRKATGCRNSVDALLQDFDGNIWASTDGGLARVEVDSLQSARFEPNRVWVLTDSSPAMRLLRQPAIFCSEV